MIKRMFDIFSSAVLIFMLSPVIICCLLVLFVKQGRPIIFKQVRVGQFGQRFSMYKFRTMVTNASRIGGHATADNDPRITPIGAFMRRSSLDELPQLFNVLTGDMSLVGPRPDVPAQMSDYRPEDWDLRTSVRPGITGLAQSRLRSAATPEQRLQLDLDYARHNGVIQDIAILIATARQVLTKGGN
jgi:lipopolysaccharide/colanic/teichoic acid biosynthesis glycosyltransferase